MSAVIGATTPNRNDLISRVELPVIVKALPLRPGLIPSFISSTNVPPCIRHHTTSDLARRPPQGLDSNHPEHQVILTSRHCDHGTSRRTMSLWDSLPALGDDHGDSSTAGGAPRVRRA